MSRTKHGENDRSTSAEVATKRGDANSPTLQRGNPRGVLIVDQLWSMMQAHDLVGGEWLPSIFNFPIYILGISNHLNWRTPSFFRTGWPWPTNQLCLHDEIQTTHLLLFVLMISGSMVQHGPPLDGGEARVKTMLSTRFWRCWIEHIWHILVGGLEHQFYFPINIGNWRSYFSEGWPLAHQPVFVLSNIFKISLTAWFVPRASPRSRAGPCFTMILPAGKSGCFPVKIFQRVHGF